MALHALRKSKNSPLQGSVIGAAWLERVSHSFTITLSRGLTPPFGGGSE